MTSVPLCYNCNTNEVQSPFTFRDGTGFCSSSCETEAWNPEALAEVTERDLEELYNDLRYEIYKDGRYN
jgi:hypothetical protein